MGVVVNSAAMGPSMVTDSLIFYYNTNDTTNSYLGEPTHNIIKEVIDASSATYDYPSALYQVTELAANVEDSTAPSGYYSRFVGDSTSTNQQFWWHLGYSGIDERNQTITISLWLKGSGTCWLNIYDDVSGYGSSSTITLNSTWTKYSYTRAVGNYTSSNWAGVRGVLNTTDVYISQVQIERKPHSTPFTPDTRSDTQSLFDLTRNNTIDLSNMSFDSNADIDFNGSSNYINLGNITELNTGDITVNFIAKQDGSAGVNVGKHFRNFETRIEGTYFGGYIGTTTGSYWREINDAAVAHGVTTTQYNYYTYDLSYSTNKINLYANGEYKGQFDGASLGVVIAHYTTSIDLFIGQRSDSSGWFDGKLPIVSIYNRSLSTSEIKQNFEVHRHLYNL